MTEGASNATRPGRPRRPVGRFALLGLAATLVAAGGALWIVVGFLGFVTTLDRMQTVPGRRAQGVVVLTGGTDRIASAVSLMLRGDADQLLISGVNPSTTKDEIVRTVPAARDLFSCCVDLGYAAVNTAGNALETGRWVRRNNIRSLLVVTSDYHMPRALAEIGHAAPGVELTASPVITGRVRAAEWWNNAARFQLVAGEYLKYLAALARFQLDPAPPA